jgi:hypothetical protein
MLINNDANSDKDVSLFTAISYYVRKLQKRYDAELFFFFVGCPWKWIFFPRRIRNFLIFFCGILRSSMRKIPARNTTEFQKIHGIPEKTSLQQHRN